MNWHLLILVSSVPLREEHIINMKQMIGSHNKYLTFLEHTLMSPEKKNLCYKVQCQSIIILLKSTSKNDFLKFRNLPTLCTQLFQSFSKEVREKSPRRKMKSNCIISVSFQVHGSVLIKRKVKEVIKLFHRTGKCGLPSIELY